jgi:outer membrane protein assembly factor BamB
MLPDILTSPNQEPNGGWYGSAVAIGGGLIVVGAPYESLPNPLYDPTLRRQTEPSQIYGAGRVYVYSATNGALLETLTSPTPTSPGWFGASVAVGEGVIVIGAPKETSGGVTLAGNAYVYDAVTYNLLDTFTTPNPVSDDNGYGYGTSVADDGMYRSSWEIATHRSGRVYLYNLVDGTALSFSPLVTPDPQEYGRFGIDVAVGDGVIVVGAAYETSS